MDELLLQGKWEEAAALYTEALSEEAASEPVYASSLYSNRAACHLQNSAYDLSLLDAEDCIRLRPTWSRGYARRGEAFCHLQAFAHSKAACEFRLRRKLGRKLKVESGRRRGDPVRLSRLVPSLSQSYFGARRFTEAGKQTC